MVSDEYVVIVAGGKGKRMETDTPKQFLELAGRPILMHTIEAFQTYSSSISVILILPQDQFDEWRTLCSAHNFKVELDLVSGGETRFESVKNGLTSVPDQCVVAIHDGVRPLVDSTIIQKSFDTARLLGNAVVSVPLKDSIRRIGNSENSSLDRARFRNIQTPQTFKALLIKQAYEVPWQEDFTDDASVAESIGLDINLIFGSYENIKITTPKDLVVAEALLLAKKNGHI